jgi:hypothetical protein
MSAPFCIVLLGYKAKAAHTNWFPWNRFYYIFRELGYPVSWLASNELHKANNIIGRRVFIGWNDPTILELLKTGIVRKDDILLQKLTSLGKGMNSVNWGNDPKNYFKNWNWPLYKTVEDLYDMGLNIYGFGCRTVTEPFPEKHRICNKIKDRIFWITWGSTVYEKKEIDACVPIVDNFTHDVGYIGSKWGRPGRGNIDQWNAFLEPILKGRNNRLHGFGLGGVVTDDQTKQILATCKLCPVIHAPSWIAERGIQDRFYTVFTTGRFGVVDNKGVLDLFEADEVVCEENPQRYVEKSIYYLENPKEQYPFIEKVQKKIKIKYNFYSMWSNIFEVLRQDEYRIDEAEFQQLIKEVKQRYPKAFTL